MRNNELPLEVVYALESERDIISKQIYKEKLPATLTPDEDGTFIIEIPLNRDFFIDLKSATIIQYTIKGRFMSR